MANNSSNSNDQSSLSPNGSQHLTSDYYEKFRWALTDKAKSALDIMIATGIDKDLALFMLEQKWSDSDIYEIPEDNDTK